MAVEKVGNHTPGKLEVGQQAKGECTHKHEVIFTSQRSHRKPGEAWESHHHKRGLRGKSVQRRGIVCKCGKLQGFMHGENTLLCESDCLWTFGELARLWEKSCPS